MNVSDKVRKIARYIEASEWSQKLEGDYGIKCVIQPGVKGGDQILKQSYEILSCMPASLIRDCGINTLEIRGDMGPNKPYYPNHGYFVNHSVTLNADIFHHPDIPDDFKDHRGYFMTRPEQTLLHEFGHGYDEYQGNLSTQDPWLKLSGWSPEDRPGLNRLVIKSPRMPDKVGEWYYDPKSEFTRFYGKLSPWDDWADCFSFYVGEKLRGAVPSNKKPYFNNILSKYY